MKKISLKNLNLKEVEQLSREQLKNVLGGYTGGTRGGGDDPTATETEEDSCVKACGTGGRGQGDACVTTDCEAGTCGYYMGIYGCNPD